jgi:hypothetical protein
MERMSGVVEAVMDSGGVVSEAVWLGAKPILGLLVPITNDTPAIHVEVSVDGTTYNDLLTSGGTQAVELTGAGTAFVLSSDALSPLAGYVGLFGENQESPVRVRLVADATQTAEREFLWLMIA